MNAADRDALHRLGAVRRGLSAATPLGRVRGPTARRTRSSCSTPSRRSWPTSCSRSASCWRCSLLAAIAGSLARRWRVATGAAAAADRAGAVRRPGVDRDPGRVPGHAPRRARRGGRGDARACSGASACPPSRAAFFVGLLWRRLAVGDVLRRLSAALGDHADDARLRAALAGALGDPTLDVVRPARAPDGWREAAEARGQAVTRGRSTRARRSSRSSTTARWPATRS